MDMTLLENVRILLKIRCSYEYLEIAEGRHFLDGQCFGSMSNFIEEASINYV